MQIGAISSSPVNVLGNSNRGFDGNATPAAEEAQSGSVLNSPQVSSSSSVQPPEQSVQETAAPQEAASVQSQVITSADEVLGTNIDTTA